MKKKGLCSTCADDENCDFPRKFPVNQCEEFNGRNKTSQKAKDSEQTKETQKHEKTLMRA
jgi:hypothetical protein